MPCWPFSLADRRRGHLCVDDELPELPIEHGMLDKLKQRIFVARQIDQALHKVKKDNHEKSWIKEAAEAFEIDLDSDDMCV